MDFSKLKYNPFNVPKDKKLWDVYPELFRRECFSGIPIGVVGFNLDDLEKMLRFVIVFVDPLSPLADEKDFDFRAKQAMKALKLTSNERFWQEYKDQTAFFNTVLFEYFKMRNNYMYETWFSLKVGLHRLNERLRSAEMRDTDRRQAMAAVRDFAFELTQMEHQLFPDDITAKIIAEKSSQESLTGYAEQYAQQLVIDGQ